MKCITFILIFSFYMWAAHALHAQASERKCHTPTYHTRVPHKTLQSTASRRNGVRDEDVKPMGNGE